MQDNGPGLNKYMNTPHRVLQGVFSASDGGPFSCSIFKGGLDGCREHFYTNVNLLKKMSF